MSTVLVFKDYGGPQTQELLDRHWPLPAPMGLEASGVVTAVGEGVEDFAVGDEVLGVPATGHGGIAQHTVLSADKTVLKPEEISFTDAATIPVAGVSKKELVESTGATFIESGDGAADRVRQIAPEGVASRS